MVILETLTNKLLFPELTLASLAGVVLLLDLWIFQKLKIINYFLVQAGLLIVAFMIYKNFSYLQDPEYLDLSHILTNNGFILTDQINSLKLILVILLFIIFSCAKRNPKILTKYGEYLTLNLLSLIGLMLTISSNNLFNVYFGLEMFAIGVYGLVAFNLQRLSIEAILKYLVLNTIFSGIFLYGLSLIYGAIGNLDFPAILQFITTQHISTLFRVGVALVFIGLLFKLHLVPFHLWAPDLYQGADLTVLMTIASLPKVATITILGRLLIEVFHTYMQSDWQKIFIIISLVSILIGNLGAILQNNIKRLLAYAGVAQVGFAMLGLVGNDLESMWAANFYIIIYSFTLIGILGGAMFLAKLDPKYEEVPYLNGLVKNHPWFSLIFLLLILSMLGLPPLPGFFAKLFMLTALIKQELIFVAILGFGLSLLNLFYYLKLIKLMYFPK